MNRIGLSIGAALLVGLAGCEGDPVSPQGEGEVFVGVTADGSEGGPSRSLSGSGEAEGSVTVTARVEVWTEAEGWIELTNGAETRTLSRGSGEVQTMTTARLEARTYNRVRVHFEDVHATGGTGLEADLGIGSAEVRVDVGADGRTTVERDLEVRVRSGQQTRLTMNLNSDVWLARANGGTVSEGSFAGAVQIVAE